MRLPSSAPLYCTTPARQELCSPRSFGYDSVVCVCNATYCDQPGIINFPEEGSFTVVTSSRDGLRFNVETFPVSSEDDLDAEEITVNREDVYHTILGFGGAFTDSTGLNVVALSSQLQEHFLRSYFAPEGIGYTIGRIPIAGCDCSTRTYSYDDVEGDDDLVHWNLTEEDHKYKWKINAIGWSAESMRDWLRDNLGPTLEAAGYRRLKMMVHDFNRDSLISYIEPMLADPECAKYIDGTAVHWYSDNIISPEILDKIHALSPERFILYTEACQGWDVEGSELSVNLGSWLRAEQYVHSMLDAVNHYSTGWVDWNMALDTLGGPNWANIFLDAPVIIDAEAKEFYKQPMFYAIGHLSKFVVPGAKRISSSTSSNWLEAAAFIDPSGRTVVVVLNKDDDEEQLTVTDGSSYFLNFKIPPKAIQTILY
ncbi:lysosomal acid glucosylceramidase-like isoform X3 [Procambarus clarkii]|uniref:lysosomal acid glucosylceramidase-like isoform X3 n=1 Tax=Procambarus clarkii TaxID=6728 RepID=UPI003743040F